MAARFMVIALTVLAGASVACTTEPKGHRVTVTPGVTVFRNGEVLPGDMIICRALNGSVGAGVPERRGSVTNSSGVTVSTDANGIVTASCSPSISSS